MAKEITDQNFETEVLQSNKTVMVDFWATWCGPCRTLGPIIDELADEIGDQAVVGKLDVDNNQDTAGKYGIRSIPTILIFKDGEVVEKLMGVQPKQVLLDKLAAHQ